MFVPAFLHCFTLQAEKPSEPAGTIKVAKTDGRLEDKVASGTPANAVCKIRVL